MYDNYVTLKSRLTSFFSSILPGIFIIGYIVGTGSVTTMISSGARYGMSLIWALLLSCIFSLVIIIAVSKLTIVSGKTLFFNIKNNFSGWIALALMGGLLLTMIASVIGVMGVMTEALYDWSKSLDLSFTLHPVITALIFIGLLYYLFWIGSHNLFLNALAIMVAIMVISFISTAFLSRLEPVDIAQGFIPNIPQGDNPYFIIAGMVGTTMASVVLVSRSILVHEKKWTTVDLRVQNRDAIISMTITFLVSMAIIAAATGTLHRQGLMVDNAIDMVVALEPFAGRFAAALFIVGIICAGLSSIFPNLLLLPWLICDYTDQERELRQTKFRVMVFLLAILGFFVPLFGGKPVVIMIASQAISPVIMPLLIIVVIILMNKRDVMGQAKNDMFMNLCLIMTLIFSVYMCYIALMGFAKV
tara:strand:+ start:9834 stop:11081 length:1248 start_codon:yes stop_codon:yes gene_type:complete